MKILGRILLILGILALLGGGTLVTLSALEVTPLVNDLYSEKEAIEKEVDQFRDLISDADLLRQRAISLIDDYNAGEVRNPDDPRLRKFLSDARDLASRSEDTRGEVEKIIKKVEKIADRLESRALDLARLGGAGGILMVLSGWIFVLGMLCLRQ